MNRGNRAMGEAARQLEERAFALRMQRFTFREVGQEIGYSRYQAYQLYARAARRRGLDPLGSESHWGVRRPEAPERKPGPWASLRQAVEAALSQFDDDRGRGKAEPMWAKNLRAALRSVRKSHHSTSQKIEPSVALTPSNYRQGVRVLLRRSG